MNKTLEDILTKLILEPEVNIAWQLTLKHCLAINTESWGRGFPRLGAVGQIGEGYFSLSPGLGVKSGAECFSLGSFSLDSH